MVVVCSQDQNAPGRSLNDTYRHSKEKCLQARGAPLTQAERTQPTGAVHSQSNTGTSTAFACVPQRLQSLCFLC